MQISLIVWCLRTGYVSNSFEHAKRCLTVSELKEVCDGCAELEVVAAAPPVRLN
jgi:hypothetical protein